MTIPPGVLSDLPAEQYHAAEGVSASMLKKLRRSPAHLRSWMANKPEPTPKMILGSILHQCLLEPAKPAWWLVSPQGMDGRSKEGREFLNSAKELKMEPIQYKDWQHILGMLQAIEEHPIASQAFATGKSEVSVFSQFTLGGTVMRRGRMDFVNDGPCIVDLKMCQDARQHAFELDIAEYGHHIQASYYLDMWNAENPKKPKTDFIFVAVEETPPHGLMVYRCGDDMIRRGRKKYIDLLSLYIRCCAE